MSDDGRVGGFHYIYEVQLGRLKHADIAGCAAAVDLPLENGQAVTVPFAGAHYRISRQGVRRTDGRIVPEATASALIHFVLDASRSRPVGRFVTFGELAGPLFGQGSYSRDALERPIIKRFQGRVQELLAVAEQLGGRQAGEAGLGGISLIFDLLPHMPLQLVFYDRDEDYPARATLLYDPNCTRMVQFEVLAVLATIFVRALVRGPAGP